MNISSSLFEAFLKCPIKCWLRANGEQCLGNGYAEWVKNEGESFLATEIERILSEMPEEKSALSLTPESVKTGKWRLATNIMTEVHTNSCVVESQLHAVERVPSEGRGKPAQFIPIRFISHNKLTKDDKLLLAFDAFVFAEMLGRKIGFGKIIHGDDHATLTVKTARLEGEVSKQIEKIIALLSNTTPPDLVLNRHCPECEFRDRCQQNAIETDDLSLLTSMSAKERQKLRSKGIFTVHQLSFTFRPRKPPKRARNPSNPRHYALHAQAIREKTVYVHGKPMMPDSQTSLFFDIEGVPWRESFYLIGVLVVEDGHSGYQSFWTNGDDQTAMFRDFCRFASNYQNAALFHYGQYDVNALRKMGQLVSEQERKALERILSLVFNILPVVHSHIYFPFHSTRLRQVATYLGSSFTSGIGSGLESIIFRERWLSSGKEELKNRLLAYNREDCEALRKLCNFIRHSVAFGETMDRVPGRQEKVALSESLKRTGEGNRPIFKKAEFVLPEFETINPCAYFDYQSEKVYARMKRKVAGPGRRPAHTARRASQDTEVVLTCSVCPQCGSKQLSLRKPLKRRLIDLKFFKTGIGVKRWQPSYLIQKYHCRTCGARITSPGIVNAENRNIYGHNLMCWCVYHNIICKQSLLQVERSLADIFNLKLPYKNVYRFRSRLAAHYRPLQDEILAAILREDVINIDETPVNLRKTTGYVWVLATCNKVYYVYKETREGGFLKELLAEFSGVLVADFFTAYDSLECQHQKCLVHLMRDINDDLRRHPFDEELRYIAQQFGVFLAKVVSTIERWGLKAYHLHKHKVESDRMLQRIKRRSFVSEQAVKYQRRFDKYAESLFTFLCRDNVPWNNNNAEHAVHYFAKVRRFTDGTFTSSSIGELLTLATVLQTCEYSGNNPLNFLLSGESSLAAVTGRNHRPSVPRC